MSKAHFEPLSFTDYGLLATERPYLPMHIAGLAVFRAGHLRTSNGGIDFDSLRRCIAGVLHEVPRYRQKLMWPVQADHSAHNETWLEMLQAEPPVWVDDEQFDLDYHLHHASVARPGDSEQLDTLVGEIMSHSLDRSKPLWEIWIIEGLRANQFAILYKIHHCLADGIASVELAQHLLTTDDSARARRPKAYHPRQAPSPKQLRRAIQEQKVKASMAAAQETMHSLLHPLDAIDRIKDTVQSTGELFNAKMLAELSETPINGTPGYHRLIARQEMPLKEIKKIKNAWNTTINNVVLVIVTGALRNYLRRHKCDPGETPFRVGMPVNLRAEGVSDGTDPHNEISIVMLDLPIAESRPLRQLKIIESQTQELDKASQSKAVKIVSAVMQFVPGLLSAAVDSASGPINSYVTNIPGPQQPLYTCGAQMVSCYPFAPLIGKIGLCIGVLSYNGKLCWGINADSALVPDADRLADLIAENFERVKKAAS